MTLSVTRREPIRVLLVDAQPSSRSTIRNLIEDDDDIAVIAEADDGQDALALAASAEPDVALIDVGIPDVDAIEVTRWLAESTHPVRVVLLSMEDEEPRLLQGLQSGAVGFVQKTAQPVQLQLAVRAAAHGQSFLCPSSALGAIRPAVERAVERDAKSARLTRRQGEVLKLLAKGHTTREIALKLGLSIKTVESHRGAIMRRLETRNVAELVQEAIRMGLLGP